MTDFNRVLQIKTELAALPKGRLSKKTINGHERYYLQGRENGKSYTRYIKKDVFDDVMAAVRRRDELQEELQQLTGDKPAPLIFKTGEDDNYRTRVFTGAMLRTLTATSAHFKHRDCFAELEQYLKDATPGRLCLVTGLRRTGKTLMMLQAAAFLPSNETAYIAVQPADTFDALHHDIMKLIRDGVRQIFLDDVTNLAGFVASAAVFADLYATMSVKIVLSGTKSMKLLLAEAGCLFGRTVRIHTTFLSYRECVRLLHARSLDNHLRFGGTLSFDYQSTFTDIGNAKRYPQAALVDNLTAALTDSREVESYRSVIELCQTGSLGRHLDRLLKKEDTALLNALFKDSLSPLLPEGVSDSAARYALARLDEDEEDDSTEKLTTSQEKELIDCLEALDFVVPGLTLSLASGKASRRPLALLPGLRFSRLLSLIHEWLKAPCFAELSLAALHQLGKQLTDVVLEQLMKDLLLLETLKSLPDNGAELPRAFAVHAKSDDFDLVIAAEDGRSCRVFRVVHCTEASPELTQAFNDAKTCGAIKARYGEMKEKAVIYLGPDQTVDSIHWINAEDYLKSLPRPNSFEGKEQN